MMSRNVVAIALLLALGACGGGGSDSGGSDAAPQCADVFAAGATIPEPFDGCYDGKTPVGVAEYECEDGEGALVATDDAFGRVGGAAQERTEDAYSAEFDKCKGL